MRLELNNLIYETDNEVKIERLKYLGAKEIKEEDKKSTSKAKSKKDDGDSSTESTKKDDGDDSK